MDDVLQKYLLPDLKNQYMTPIDPSQLAQLQDQLPKNAEDFQKMKLKAQAGNLGLDANGNVVLNSQVAAQAPQQKPMMPTGMMPDSYVEGKDNYIANRRKKDELVSRDLAQQASGINQLQDQYNQIAQQSRPVDWSALAAYFDSTVPGSKLMQGYTPPETEAQKQQRLMNIQEKIQAAKQGLSASEIAAMKESLNSDLIHNSMGLQRAQLNDTRLMNQADMLRKSVDKDDVIKSQDSVLSNIGRGIDRLKKPGVVNDNLWKEIQSDFAQALMGGRLTSEGAQARTQMDMIESQIAHLKQKWESMPANVDAAQAKSYLLEQMQALAQYSQDVKNQRVNYIKHNANLTMANNPYAQNYLQELNGNSFNPTSGMQGSGIMSNLTPDEQAMITEAQKPENKNNPDAIKILKHYEMQ